MAELLNIENLCQDDPSAALFALLARLGIESQTYAHPPLYTVEESKALRGNIAGAHCKNLFVKDKKGNLFLIVAQESKPIDLKASESLIGAKGRVTFANAELLQEILGVTPGSVTPFGAIHDLDARVQIVLDADMMAEPLLNYHPLVNTRSTVIKAPDLMKFLEATGHRPLLVTLPQRISTPSVS